MSEKNKDVDAAEAAVDEATVEDRSADEATVEDASADETTGEAAPVDDAVEEEPAGETARDEPRERTPEPGRSPSSIAWLAMFFSLLTLAAVGYMIMEDRRAKATAETSSDEIEQLAGRVDASSASLSDFDQELADLASSDEATRSRVESLQSRVEDRLELLDSLPRRMSNLENSIASLQGISAGARDHWLLAEAEYYMQIANAQLQLGNNPHLAMLALGMADERVVQMANPALTEVRRAIADELAALEVMDKPDIEGVSLTLASLSRVVESLPLQAAEESAEAGTSQTGEDVSGTARAWASVKDAMTGIVKVTPPDAERRALLTPDTEQLIRSNLALQLQAARLALLRGERAIFEQSLDDANALLEAYFDVDSAPVTSARQTIAEIRDSMIAVTPPDISESLRLIRQFRTLSELSESEQ